MEKLSVYVVEAWLSRCGRLVRAERIEFESERRARAHAESLRPRRAGVVLYMQRGQPEVWGDPVLLQRFGIALRLEVA